MKGLKFILAAAVAVCAAFPASAFPNEPDGFGDMRWGDSVKKVSERYASRYLEKTQAGGALYAVRFSDFKKILGIEGPLTVMAAFDAKGKLVQINVPLATDTADEAAAAFSEYTGNLETLCGAPERKDDAAALWQGKKTNVFVQKREEGILVAFIDAASLKKAAK